MTKNFVGVSFSYNAELSNPEKAQFLAIFLATTFNVKQTTDLYLTLLSFHICIYYYYSLYNAMDINCHFKTSRFNF